MSYSTLYDDAREVVREAIQKLDEALTELHVAGIRDLSGASEASDQYKERIEQMQKTVRKWNKEGI